ncbi:hypothetical protein ACQP3C_30925, partial [Escherichia coli]
YLQDNSNATSMALECYVLVFNQDPNVPTYVMSSNPQGDRDVHKEVKTNNSETSSIAPKAENSRKPD